MSFGKRTEDNWNKSPENLTPDDHFREESLEERQQKKGYEQGLKHIYNLDNFKDFDNLTKPQFGIPTVLFDTPATSIDKNQDIWDQTQNRTNELWSFISNGIYINTDGTKDSVVVKDCAERAELRKRWYF